MTDPSDQPYGASVGCAGKPSVLIIGNTVYMMSAPREQTIAGSAGVLQGPRLGYLEQGDFPFWVKYLGCWGIERSNFVRCWVMRDSADPTRPRPGKHRPDLSVRVSKCDWQDGCTTVAPQPTAPTSLRRSARVRQRVALSREFARQTLSATRNEQI